MRYKHLLIIILLLWHTTLFATNYHFIHINSENGLPHQQVEALIQDDKGNIWIGTRNGLSCYDGYDIKTYFHDDKNPNSLSHNFVNALYLDKKKRIWVCTQNGICRYRPATDDFKSYKSLRGIVSSVVETSKGKIICGGDQLSVLNEKSDTFVQYPSLGYGYIISLAVNNKDNLYVATNSSIFYYDSSLTKITSLDRSYYSNFITYADGIIPMIFDSYGNLWMGRNGKGVMKIDLNKKKNTIYASKEISNGIVRVITEDKLHRIWLGTEKGITIINHNGPKEIIRHDFQDPYQLSDNAIYSIISDKNSNMWIGSYFGGIDVLLNSNNKFLWHEPGYNDKNIKGKVPRMIVETLPNIFWIATEDSGINIYNSVIGKFSIFNKIPQIGTNVHSLYYDRTSSNMWIGTFRNGLFRYNMKTGSSKRYEYGNGLTSNSIFDFARQHNGRFWIATTQGLRYYDSQSDAFRKIGNNVLDVQFIYALCVDRSDNLWIGTVHKGLFRINAKTNKITNWIPNKNNSNLKDEYITCLHQDTHGNIWIGTNNNGLQYINPKTEKIGSLNNELLLPECTICSVAEDSYGHLWISTSQGLYQYNPKKDAITRFTTENGLPTNQFNFSSSLLTNSGNMIFGTVKGLITFNPSSIKSESGPFPVHLKQLIINNNVINASTKDSPLSNELDNTSTINLSYDQSRSFSIDYGVIMPGNTSSIEYQIFVDGIDKDWRNVGKERKFSGYNLPPGTYCLHIRANNSNEGWEKCPEKILKIIIAPPFYRSNWAYLLYLIVIGGIIYFIYHLFSIRIHERNQVKIANMEKEKIKEIDKEKFDFFTTVSHELKTPLSLIVAPLKSISRQGLNVESNKHLDTAIKNTHKMESLINELVTFNKIETNNFPFYIQNGNPLEFIELAVVPFIESSSEKNISLFVDCENNGEDVWFSPSYLEHIVDNLLSNALKFTSEGGKVSVKAKIITIENDPYTYLHIEVTDTGIGIAKDELENIFNRYYQTKRGYNVNNSGWGIGLSLVKRLVCLHKGTVNVNSEINKGSVFTINLNVSGNAFEPQNRINEDKEIVPIAQYKFTPSIIEKRDDNSQSPTCTPIENKISILIVDDNNDLLSFLFDYFCNKYNVFTAENGVVALNIAREESIQLIITDIMMPQMDGIQLCHILKQDVATSHIPVIMLTAKSESGDVVTGYESGAEAYVAKPFDPQILELQVKNIIQLQKSLQKEIANANGSEDIDSTPLTELDKDFIRKINQVLDKNISNSDFAIVDITQEIAVSRSLLHTKMKSLFNMSMGDYIRKKRLDKACQLLLDGYNVSETAYQTGFSDPNYFSKTFKKHIGCNPTEYTNIEK